MTEPYFDIVDVAMPRDDMWGTLARVVGIRLTRNVPQIKWREGGRERMERDQMDGALLLAAHARLKVAPLLDPRERDYASRSP